MLFRDHFEKSFLDHISENIKIQGEATFFEIKLLNSFLFICPKISIFRGKLCYLEITFKKSFFVHISQNIKIQGKATFLGIKL